MNNTKIYAFLRRLRDEYIESQQDSIFCENQQFVFDGENLKLNVWQDYLGTDRLIVFEVKQLALLSTETCSLGIKYSDSGELVLLTQQQLQRIGIH